MRLRPSAIYASPTLTRNGFVVAANTAGTVFALDPVSGTPHWSYATAGAVLGAPTVTRDGRILVTSADEHVYALRPEAGLTDSERLLWATNLGAVVRTSATLADREQAAYVGTDAGELVKIWTADGSVGWRFASGGAITASAAVGALGRIHFVSADSYVYTVEDRVTVAEELWRHALGYPSLFHPTVGADGTVYVASDRLYALRPLADATTRELWQVAIPGNALTAPTITATGAVVLASPELMRRFAALLGFCPVGSTCSSHLGVNFCGHQMPGTPFTVPLACPSNGICPDLSACTSMLGHRFCYQSCNGGE